MTFFEHVEAKESVDDVFEMLREVQSLFQFQCFVKLVALHCVLSEFNIDLLYNCDFTFFTEFKTK